MTDGRRILILCDVTGPGGVSLYLAQVWRAANAHGLTAKLVLDENAGADQVEAYLGSLDIPVTRSPLRPGRLNEADVAVAVDRLLSTFAPDVVHTVLGSCRSLLVARERTVAARIPLVFTEQFVSADLEISQDMLRRLRTIHNEAFAVIYVCQENRRCASRHFSLSSPRAFVIPNSVDLTTARAPRRGAPSRLLTVARFAHQKGLDILIDAMTMVRPDATLRIVGDGELRAALTAQAESLGLSAPRVHFCGWTTDVAAELAGADLFVLPSRAEGQPFALLEAMAVGLPCVATNVSGIPDALGQGLLGVLTPSENPKALAEAINAFLAAPAEGWRHADRARANVERNFEVNRNLGLLAQVWARAAAQVIGP